MSVFLVFYLFWYRRLTNKPDLSTLFCIYCFLICVYLLFIALSIVVAGLLIQGFSAVFSCIDVALFCLFS